VLTGGEPRAQGPQRAERPATLWKESQPASQEPLAAAEAVVDANRPDHNVTKVRQHDRPGGIS
jgi:hypothetical protein